MAIATSTALAIGGIAVSAGSAGMSFAQANKQRKLQTQAQSEARQAMDEARKKLEVNMYDQLNVPMEAYEREREALLSAGAQGMQAGVEGESRGAAATAGRIQAGMNEAQAGQRTSMAKELSDLQRLSAEEDSRLRDIGVQLDLGEVEGAQLAARDAQQARAAAIEQGMEGVTSMVQQGVQLAPLYNQDLGAQKSALSKVEFNPEQFAEFEKLGGKPLKAGESSSLDFQTFGSMNNIDYRQYMKSLSPQQRQMLFQNKQYLQNYNPYQPF